MTAPSPSDTLTTIVVGLDGVAYGDQALVWAADQAALIGAQLDLVHAVDQELREADPVLAHARWLLGVLRFSGPVRECPVVGEPHEALAAAAADAVLLVVGSRGRRTVADLLRARIAPRATAEAAGCPLVVVRPDHVTTTGGGVLVGVDDCGRCGPAIEVAFAQAAIRGLPLTALGLRPGEGEPSAEDEVWLGGIVAPYAAAHPEVTLRPVVARGPADEVLVAASQGQDLVVLGSHVHPPLSAEVVEDVDRWVLAHAACAVAVVPTGRPESTPTFPPADEPDLVRIVTLARRAPSVFNTQPWAWSGAGHILELAADLTRWLRHTDPDGRDLLISCGAVLQHARVAAEALGWQISVENLLPAAPAAFVDCLPVARLTLTRMATAGKAAAAQQAEREADLAAMARRRTDRRRFTDWPVPVGTLRRLAEVAASRDCKVASVTTHAGKTRVLRLIDRAEDLERRSDGYLRELTRWTSGASRLDAVEGVPARTVPHSTAGRAEPANRFVARDSDVWASASDLEEPGGEILILGSASDSPAGWLAVGESLAALWLAACRRDLSVLPLSQATEVAETRGELGRLAGDDAIPAIVLRVGWQETSREPFEPTPRRTASVTPLS